MKIVSQHLSGAGWVADIIKGLGNTKPLIFYDGVGIGRIVDKRGPEEVSNLIEESVFVCRDPRDVAVAAWFAVVGRRGHAHKKYRYAGLADFLTSDDGLQYVINTMNRWASSRGNCSVKFESLVLSVDDAIKHVLEFFGMTWERSKVKEARRIGLEVVDHMKDRLGGELTGRHRLYEVGLHERVLTRKQIAWCDHVVKRRLDPEFGYQ